MREVAEVILERREAGDCLSFDLEGGHPVGDALFSMRQRRQDVLAELFKHGSLRFLNPCQIAVNVDWCHPNSVQRVNHRGQRVPQRRTRFAG